MPVTPAHAVVARLPVMGAPGAVACSLVNEIDAAGTTHVPALPVVAEWIVVAVAAVADSSDTDVAVVVRIAVAFPLRIAVAKPCTRVQAERLWKNTKRQKKRALLYRRPPKAKPPALLR